MLFKCSGFVKALFEKQRNIDRLGSIDALTPRRWILTISTAADYGFLRDDWLIKIFFRNFQKRSGPLKTNAAVPEKQTFFFFWP